MRTIQAPVYPNVLKKNYPEARRDDEGRKPPAGQVNAK